MAPGGNIRHFFGDIFMAPGGMWRHVAAYGVLVCRMTCMASGGS
jgi:hypothetical protein